MSRLSKVALMAASFLLPGAVAKGALPSTPEAVPPGVAAVVSHVPTSLGRLTKIEVAQGLVEQSAGAGRAVPPSPGTVTFDALREAALSERLDMIWVEGQAREMRIVVTSRQVGRRLAQIRRNAFDDAADYREFLRELHFTRRDVRTRVRAQILSAKIQRRVVRLVGVDGFDEFVSSYTKRWRARTV